MARLARRRSTAITFASSSSLLLLLILQTINADISNGFLSTCDITDRTCGPVNNVGGWNNDGECDAPQLCPNDCADCDPLRQYGNNCFDCVAAGGEYCESNGRGSGQCNLPEIVASDPTLCAAPSDYTRDCVGLLGWTCSVASDTCPYQDDGECDVDTNVCNAGTDCNDCDPCMQLRFQGCETCTAAGCVWCGAEALCFSQAGSVHAGYQSAPPYTCTAQDFVSTCPTPESNTIPFSTPLAESSNWIYDIINVKPVWARGILGTGINIRVNDNGIDSNHPDLRDNFDFDNSCPQGHLPPTPDKLHGTSCAAIAAGSSNGSCSTGIAPNASISGCDMFSNIEFQVKQKFLYTNQPTVHISSNSYVTPTCGESRRRRRDLTEIACPFHPNNPRSPCRPGAECQGFDWGSDVSTASSDACETEIINYCQKYFDLDPIACADYLNLFISCYYNGLTPEESDALTRGVRQGRDGKGIVYVFSSGNGYKEGANVNFEGIQQSRYTISVGGVGKLGFHSSYSNPGAALFISAPAGDSPEFYSNFIVARAMTETCHHANVGTSFACPVVSGVVALMLEANPDLTWRDVQEILAKTAQVKDPSHPSWVTNAAGYHHSYLYGFGVVDADAAVTEAMSWDLLRRERQIVLDSGEVNVIIPEYKDGSAEASIAVGDDESTFLVESVSILLNLRHFSRGDLEIMLTSPSGTESLVHPGPRPENTVPGRDERWKFMTLRNWGEVPTGEWKLTIVDKAEADLEECVDFEYQPQRSDGAILTCDYLSSEPPECKDGNVLPSFFTYIAPSLDDPIVIDPVNGLGPADACCSCGGGFLASSTADILISWKLQIFGHYLDGQPTTSPTQAPTGEEVPSTSPIVEDNNDNSNSSTNNTDANNNNIDGVSDASDAAITSLSRTVALFSMLGAALWQT